MTQPLEELLAQVRSAEAEPVAWAEMQTRVVRAMASTKPMVTQGSNGPGASSNASPQTLATSHISPSTWLGAGIAAGVVVAGLLLTNQRPALFESEARRGDEPALSPHPIVLDALIPESGAEVWSPRTKSSKTRATSIPEHRQAQTLDVPAKPGPAPAAPEARELGESDVEYDRRHLAPIDAALQAHQPRKALELSSAFKPRKLTNYARALRAIALCGVGQSSEGKRLGEQTLPQLTNRGLARRVQTACKLSRASED
jgi:hypothetical protein